MSLQNRFHELERDISRQRENNKEWILNNDWTEDDYLYETVPITFDTYQDSTLWSKCRNPTSIPAHIFYALGLGGECGELLNYCKKMVRNDDDKLTEKRLEQITGEIGDTLWYLNALAKEFGIKMSDVAAASQKKMLIRLKEHNEKCYERTNETDNNSNSGFPDNGDS